MLYRCGVEKSKKSDIIRKLMDNKTITIDGGHLTINHIYRLVSDLGVSIEVPDSNFKILNNSVNFLKKEIGRKKIIYGVNTGFGPMATHIINHGQLSALQENLIRSHAAGAGDAIKSEYVLASMVVRLNTLVKGYSGVSPDLIKILAKFINLRIIPVIPEHGAVGTSGDLVQLAHIALALIGEGEVFYKGKKQPTANVLKQLRIRPYKLKPKEGLALINGTSVMTGIAAILCVEADRLISVAVRLGALALEQVRGFDDSISEKLHSLRPHRGQILIAKALRKILADSEMIQSRDGFQKNNETPDEVHRITEEVQQVYSLRCIPQIVGPVLDTLSKVQKDVEIEINSVTDNPIVDLQQKKFLHGGNFHGDYIAAAVDQLKMTLVKLTMLSERRINFFLNDKVNRIFPPFMNLNRPGLTLGLQGLNFVATSTTAQSQSLAFPHYVHSIPTNADNQDLVSMGTDAALLTSKVVENAYIVLAIELITLAQGIETFEKIDGFSKSSRLIFEKLRTFFPKVVEDRTMVSELPKVVEFIKTSPDVFIKW